ncbi:MAG: bifunctional hydroxymethylpyrimidine kinase/phosphomethylpyrimidine kinase [Pyrinomonadaceae bacterium]|nr:bifunctional hydroxymethylpyrimidine kinase/phosphomethylpyrimidine kinase [Pyrinomonadaceae bacterium]MCX7638989.1 bifunctional hydroxymethylpyrimidine kinase/phosphomethylpyrimidine kinase [Pyrinomonadaceae bacterium]MDW8303791.1 bifunctional hydroxymethylpyrimidine kinase/phosphomethylpyrimidine kinase [Acidobacteriota bacterium]
MQNVCLTIAGVDPSGGAGIIADVKTFKAFGCFPTAVITSITFQNTLGVFGAVHQSSETVKNQIIPILDDYEVAAFKTGMLPSEEIIEEVASIISTRRLKNLILDPVVRSTSGYDLIDDIALKSLIEKLFPLALVVTPNIPEAERICKMRIENLEDVKNAAKQILNFGAKAVLIKGGHLPFEEILEGVIYTEVPTSSKKAYDFLFLEGKLIIFASSYIETRATHGTGCVLSAAITASIAKGKSLPQAVYDAKRFVTEAIRSSPLIGKGFPPVNA